ncbi:S9 family peptidase [Alteromonas lipolytica]|uniref:S9 family peptidase n=1 Tax=Alteromonas lipolytica TaxID=1856405 RepID=UPI0009F2726C|nr:S9 family peptidase [Alteromonas lipolytica]GGF55618.1 peptidase S9 family protein [Alteromonas lipolytica]
MRSATLLIASLLISFAANAEITTRTENNGNLILEDIPPIPQKIVDDLNRYQNIRSAPFGDFTEDSENIFIQTRFGDVSQIHKVDIPGGARQQLTFLSEPVGQVARQPHTNNLAFTMDAGGSEYAQICLYDFDTRESVMLTDGESRNRGIVWNKSGKQFAYQSTRRNGSSNDIWVMSPDSPQNTSIVLESEDGSWWGPVSWSPDGKRLLVMQYISISDARMYEINVATLEKTLLAGGPSLPSYNEPSGYDKAGKSVFLITNQFSEFNQLAYLDLTTNELKPITSDLSWSVEDFALSDDGKRGAFTVNEDGMLNLYLLDPTSFKYKKVTGLPVGLVGSLSFSPDNKKLGFTVNTAKSPSDSFVMEFSSKMPLKQGEITRWTYSEVGGLDTNQFIEPELVRFNSFDGLSVPAFVYKPQTSKNEKIPVIISIHGGPEAQFRPQFIGTFQLWMKKLGAAVIAPNVRGSAGYGKAYINMDNGYKREDSVKDIGALLDWIATQPDLDSSRVAVIGGSYGGYMVLASAVHYSDRLAAAVDIVGISNFVTFLTNTKEYRRDLRRPEYGDERDDKMRAFLESISPNNHVERIKIPMFVVQGQNDPRVPVTEAEQIVKALRDEGKPVWYMNALNEGHGYRKKENRDVYTQAVVLFFEKYL